MRKPVVITLLLLSAAAGRAGTITGTIHAQGKAGTDDGASDGRYTSHEFKFVEKVDYSAMRDFVVFIDGPMTNVQVAVPTKPVQVTTVNVAQKRATFVPHVLPVMVGTTVEWPNKDDIYHNVFSYSEAKQFDLGLYKGNEAKPVTFDKTGEVDVFCSIHANMTCVVLVLQNPFFAVSDDHGAYSIANVPPGTYHLKAWHERLPVQTSEVTVSTNGEVKVDFTLGITGLPKN